VDKREVVLNQCRAILHDENFGGGPLAKHNKLKAILLESNIARTGKLHVKEILVHPQNRSRLGLNPYNAHKNLAKIKKVRGDLALLGQACCVELPPPGHQKRNETILFNEALVASSNNFLAGVFGEERYCSLSTSHCVAGC
jgi:hypothetical protein